MHPSLMIIEDEALLGEELRRHFQRLDWEVWLVRDLAEARRLLDGGQAEPMVILSDMNLPDGNALDFLEERGGRQANCEWIFLTGYGSVPDSIRALRLGAYEFLEKPCDPNRLQMVLEAALRSVRAQRRLAQETAQHHDRYNLASFIGESPQIIRLRQLLSRLAKVPFSSLVILGETGTGKGLAARILHACGCRADGPWVELNCAALPHELVEAELFGYEPGAFTGAKGRHHGLLEQADGGTLFLDEIGELELATQAKLLKAIEDKRFRRLGGEKEIQVDIQIIAASNEDLQKMIRQGHFREDLYHRISVFQLELPPLRVRKEDLRLLVPTFVAEFNTKAGKRVSRYPEALWRILESYDWPGNIRELRNLIERCVLLSEDESFPVQWINLPGQTPPFDEDSTIRLPLDGSLSLEEMEKRIIQTALERTANNVTAAARLLNTTRETLRYRIRKYHLPGLS